MTRNDIEDFAYAALQLPRTATPADVRRAYRRSALTAHPDKRSGDTEKFLCVRQAYERLSDASKRGHESAHEVTLLPTVTLLPAIGDSTTWIETCRFATREEAVAFVQRCQPFDFYESTDGPLASRQTLKSPVSVAPQILDNANPITYEPSVQGCSRRWRIRQVNSCSPWIVEQEGELFARIRSAGGAQLNTPRRAAKGAPAGPDACQRIAPPRPLYVAVRKHVAYRILEEGYTSKSRQGIPCSSTAAAAELACFSLNGEHLPNAAVNASEAREAGSGVDGGVTVLRVTALPEDVTPLPRRDGGSFLRAEYLPPWCFERA